jgi:hypothetical protein
MLLAMTAERDEPIQWVQDNHLNPTLLRRVEAHRGLDGEDLAAVEGRLRGL